MTEPRAPRECPLIIDGEDAPGGDAPMPVTAPPSRPSRSWGKATESCCAWLLGRDLDARNWLERWVLAGLYCGCV